MKCAIITYITQIHNYSASSARAVAVFTLQVLNATFEGERIERKRLRMEPETNRLHLQHCNGKPLFCAQKVNIKIRQLLEQSRLLCR